MTGNIGIVISIVMEIEDYMIWKWWKWHMTLVTWSH